jgi:outer membrane protein assembly factor BamD (BamD/ComL family)
MPESARKPDRPVNRSKHALMALPAVLSIFTLIIPATVSCQRHQPDTGRGTAELRALVAAAQGRPAASDLERVESKYPQTRAAALARFLRGYLYYSAQNYAAAVDALDARAISAHSALGDYAYFFRAESEAANNARGEALRDYGIIYTKYSDSLRARDAKLRAAEMAIALKDFDSAVKELAPMVESADADALYLRAQINEATEKNDEAIKIYRRLYYKLPATKAAVNAEARLAALGADVKQNPASFEDERARSDALFAARQYAEASRAYDQLIARFPEAEQVDEIQLKRGISQRNASMPAQAVSSLVRVSDANPAMKAEALFNQAEALRRSNRAGESGTVVDRLVKQYSNTRWAEDALYNLAKDADKADREAEAAARFRQLLAAFPKSQYAA